MYLVQGTFRGNTFYHAQATQATAVFNNIGGQVDNIPVQQSPVVIISAAHTNIASATSSTLLLAANANRKPGSVIANDSSVLYIKLGTGASASSYMVALDAKTTIPGVLFLPDGYLGAVYGAWVSATGFARVTELS